MAGAAAPATTKKKKERRSRALAATRGDAGTGTAGHRLQPVPSVTPLEHSIAGGWLCRCIITYGMGYQGQGLDQGRSIAYDDDGEFDDDDPCLQHLG